MVALTASFLIGLPGFTCHPLRGIQTVKGTANALHLYAELSMLNANAFAACGQYVFYCPEGNCLRSRRWETVEGVARTT